jgi:hypothetical protein
MSKRPTLRALIALLGLLLVVLAAPALGQPSAEEEEQGKQLAREGFEAYKQGDYQTALTQFEQARAVYPTGQVLRMTGYTLLALERWDEAASTLEAALKTEYKPLADDVRAEVQGNLDEALKHVATVVVTSDVLGATVSIDSGDPLGLPAEVRLLEGTHTFVVSAEGHKDAERSMDLPGGERLEIEMHPTRLDAPKPQPQPQPQPQPEPEEPAGPGWFPHQKEIGFAVGGAGLAVGVTGVALLVAGSSLRSATQENIDAHNADYGADCSKGSYELCYYDAMLINEDGARAQSQQTAGLVMTLVGGTLLATGVLFVAFAPWGDESEAEGAGSGDAAGDEARRGAPQTWVRCGPYGQAGLGCVGTF